MIAHIRHLITSLIGAALAAAMLPGCSSDGIAGTETGNPEIVACAQAAFDAVDNDSIWRAGAYVPGGRSRLDPNTLFGGPAPSGLAKTIVSGVNDTITVSDTTFVIRRLVIRDTLLVPDTTFVDDTLTGNVYLVTDTITGGDTSTTLINRIVTDYIYVKDTVVFEDTLVYSDTLVDTLVVIAGTDTTWGTPKDSSPVYQDALGGNAPGTLAYLPSDMIYGSPTFNYDSGAYLQIVSRNVQTKNEAAIAVPLSGYQLVPAGVYYSINKRTSGASGEVYEEYSDIDGNGFAKSGAAGGVPRLRFIHRSATTVAIVDFDAGVDANFVTTGDNGILALTRTDVAGVRTVRSVFASNGSPLSVASNSSSGNIAADSIAYATSIANDTLYRVEMSRNYRSGRTALVVLSMTASTVVAAGAPMTAFALSATVTGTDGAVWEIRDAVLDVNEGVIRGVYEVSGRTFRFTAYRDGEVVVEE